VYAVAQDDPSNVVHATNFHVVNATLVDALFNFGSANCGKVWLLHVVGPGGPSRNLTELPVGTPAGVPLGNEQGTQVSFNCNDLTPPDITCPADQFSRAKSRVGHVRGAVVNYPAPTATDNCSGVVTVTCVPASGSFFPVGVNTVTCTATDANGNSSNCTFKVTVGKKPNH
jgi:hypothetical protein